MRMYISNFRSVNPAIHRSCKEIFKHWGIICVFDEQLHRVVIEVLRCDVSLEFSCHFFDLIVRYVLCIVVYLENDMQFRWIVSMSFWFENEVFKCTHDVLNNVFLVGLVNGFFFKLLQSCRGWFTGVFRIFIIVFSFFLWNG